MTRDELVAKFEANASHVETSQTEALIDMILDLDEIVDVSALLNKNAASVAA